MVDRSVSWPGLPSCVGNTWYILPRWWKHPSAQSSWPPWPFEVAQSFPRAFHHFEVVSWYADFICLQPGCLGNKFNLRDSWIIIYFILQNLQRTLIQRRCLINVCHTNIEITSFWGVWGLFFFLIGSKSKISVFIVQYDIVYALPPQMLWADPSLSIQQRLWFFLHLCLPCKERRPSPPGAAGTRGLAASQSLCAGRGSHHISAWSVVGVIIYSWDMYFSRLSGKNPRFGTNRF